MQQQGPTSVAEGPLPLLPPQQWHPVAGSQGALENSGQLYAAAGVDVSGLSSEEPLGDDDDEDYAESRDHKRAKRHHEPQQPRPRFESAMTAKLRSAEPVKSTQSKSSSGGNSDEDSCYEDDIEQGPEPLVREVGPQEAAQDLQAIRCMWELGVVFEFLNVFKSYLRLSHLYPMADLEQALVDSPGPGLLANLHVELLQGLSARSNVDEHNWPSYLASRLVSEATAMGLPLHQLPFRPKRGREAQEYACLAVRQRVLALKALCDIRGDREDMRGLLDETINPGSAAGSRKKQQQQPPAPPQASRSSRRRGGDSAGTPEPGAFNLTAEEAHGKLPLGVDASGAAYYWFDMPLEHHGQSQCGLVGSRIYKSGPQLEGSEEQEGQQQAQGQEGQEQQQQGQGQPGASSGLPPKPPARLEGSADGAAKHEQPSEQGDAAAAAKAAAAGSAGDKAEPEEDGPKGDAQDAAAAAAAVANGVKEEQGGSQQEAEREVPDAPSQQTKKRRQKQQQQKEDEASPSKAAAGSSPPDGLGVFAFRDKPRRKAAADAVVKMQHQRASQTGPFRASEDGADGSGAAAAAGGGGGQRRASGGSSGARGSSGGGGRGRRRKGGPKVPYKLPPDLASGPWQLVADDRDSFLALGEQLAASSKAADREVGQLVLEAAEVLKERQEKEAKYAKAHSRVMKALGLDLPAPGGGGGAGSGGSGAAVAAAGAGGAALELANRAARSRKVINYAFDDYDKHMKAAIRRHERGLSPFPEPTSGRSTRQQLPPPPPPRPAGVRSSRRLNPGGEEEWAEPTGSGLDAAVPAGSGRQPGRSRSVSVEPEWAGREENGEGGEGNGDLPQQQQQHHHHRQQQQQPPPEGAGDGEGQRPQRARQRQPPKWLMKDDDEEEEELYQEEEEEWVQRNRQQRHQRGSWQQRQQQQQQQEELHRQREQQWVQRQQQQQQLQRLRWQQQQLQQQRRRQAEEEEEEELYQEEEEEWVQRQRQQRHQRGSWQLRQQQQQQAAGAQERRAAAQGSSQSSAAAAAAREALEQKRQQQQQQQQELQQQQLDLQEQLMQELRQQQQQQQWQQQQQPPAAPLQPQQEGAPAPLPAVGQQQDQQHQQPLSNGVVSGPSCQPLVAGSAACTEQPGTGAEEGGGTGSAAAAAPGTAAAGDPEALADGMLVGHHAQLPPRGHCHNSSTHSFNRAWGQVIEQEQGQEQVPMQE